MTDRAKRIIEKTVVLLIVAVLLGIGAFIFTTTVKNMEKNVNVKLENIKENIDELKEDVDELNIKMNKLTVDFGILGTKFDDFDKFMEILLSIREEGDK